MVIIKVRINSYHTSSKLPANDYVKKNIDEAQDATKI